jgi:hypothetical protein
MIDSEPAGRHSIERVARVMIDARAFQQIDEFLFVGSPRVMLALIANPEDWRWSSYRH